MSRMSELALEIEEAAANDVISGEFNSVNYTGMCLHYYTTKRDEFADDYNNHLSEMAERHFHENHYTDVSF